MESLLTDAKHRGIDRILILDDDVMLHRDFQKRFVEAWSELPDDWVLVYLGTAQADPSKVTRYSDHLYHPGAMANGSYAVAIDAAVFDQALASIRRFDWPFDAGALREIDAAQPGRVFSIEPPLVLANVADSSIRPGRAMDAHAAKHGWDLSDYEEPLGPS
jgi:GR25 family glycosyltransferase involved in LPS biosynthesis